MTRTEHQFTFLVVEITPISIKSIGYRTYIYFCVFNFCFIPMIYYLYPETANLTLEQIDHLFTGNKVLRHLPDVRLCFVFVPVADGRSFEILHPGIPSCCQIMLTARPLRAMQRQTRLLRWRMQEPGSTGFRSLLENAHSSRYSRSFESVPRDTR